MSMVAFNEVGEYKLDRAVKLLAGIPGGTYQAVGSAIKRAAEHGLTVGMRIASEEYAISQGELKYHTRHINTVVKDGAGSYEVTFGYRGNVIPLIRFDTQFSRDGKITTRVLRQNARQELDHAFAARVSAHTGVFERETSARLPIKELFGPSAIQAFSHEGAVNKMDEEILKTYDQRIEHEITRVLNGWGGKS